jgi:quercetin dioxygenase-like cupin family protein
MDGMRAYMSDTVPAEPAEGLPGVRIRWIIGKNVDAPNFAMRIVEVEPGYATAYHEHPWEHEVYVLEGQGYVRAADDKADLVPGMCVFTKPGEAHCFANDGDALLRFVCVIPWPDA